MLEQVNGEAELRYFPGLPGASGAPGSRPSSGSASACEGVYDEVGRGRQRWSAIGLPTGNVVPAGLAGGTVTTEPIVLEEGAMRVLLGDWGSWVAARFSSQEARDRFLHTVGTAEPVQSEAEPMPGEDQGALVRWRSGQFLRLNDIAYTHGGRIVVVEKRSSRPQWRESACHGGTRRRAAI